MARAYHIEQHKPLCLAYLQHLESFLLLEKMTSEDSFYFNFTLSI